MCSYVLIIILFKLIRSAFYIIPIAGYSLYFVNKCTTELNNHLVRFYFSREFVLKLKPQMHIPRTLALVLLFSARQNVK